MNASVPTAAVFATKLRRETVMDLVMFLEKFDLLNVTQLDEASGEKAS